MSELESLSTLGITTVTYPQTLKDQVRAAAEAWHDFVAQPQEVKNTFTYTNASAGVGYEKKEGQGNHADTKENFDMSATYADELEGSDETNFIDSAKALSVTMGGYALETVHQMGQEFNIEALRDVQPRDLATFVRFLYYPAGTSVGGLLGEPHTDQSGFTFHLYENTDGCERLDKNDRTWQPMPVESGQAAVFGAMQLHYLSEGRIPALTHRIIANERSYRQGRIAIVCFVRFLNAPVYDKETYGRLQEKEPGFQYDLPLSEFKKLFRP